MSYGGGVVRYYINGNFISEHDAPVIEDYNIAPRTGLDLRDRNELDGWVSNLAVWNKVLSDTEVTDIYNYGIDANNTNLTSLWKLDEGTGSTAYDSAGTNDGAITGASWADGESPLYRPATSGQPIPGISQGDDLSGLKLYGRQLLNASDATMQSFTLQVSTAAAITASRRMRSRIF